MPFKKGQSGNPGGRKKVDQKVTDLARKYTTDAIKALARIMNDKKSGGQAVVAAANALLDRGWGKPRQVIDGDKNNPLSGKWIIEFTNNGTKD